MVCGIETISIELLKQWKNANEDLVIIITSSFLDEIIGVLSENNISFKNIFTVWGLKHCIHANIDSECINSSFREFYMRKYRVHNYITKQYEKTARTYLQVVDTLDKIETAENPVLIYTGGRVGSVEMTVSINQHGYTAVESHGFPIVSDLDFGDDKWFSDMSEVAEDYLCLLNKIKEKKLKIISLIREPIAQDLSSFFYCLDQMVWYDFPQMSNDFVNCAANVIQKSGKGILEWYTKEFVKTTGINVYEYDFDKEKGYARIQNSNYDILLLQSEKVHSLENIIGEFIGISNFKIEKETGVNNADTVRKYSYQEFLEEVKLPLEYVNYYYKNNVMMEHFYSKEDQKRFMERWKKNIKKEL